MIFSFFDETFRVSLQDLYYFKRNILSIMITIMVTPLLYYVSFCYGLGSNVNNMEGVPYVAFVIPGVIALSTLTSCFSSIANKVLSQRIYYTSFDEIILCPISPSAVIFGKALIGFIRGMIGCFILLAIGLVMTDGLHISVMLILSIAVSCVAFSLLGVLVGFLSNSLTTIIMFTTVLVVPMTFLCGTVFSVSSLPTGLQYIIAAMPLTYSTDCIRSAALDWSFPMLSLLIVIVWSVVFFSICYYMLVKGKL
ncbi:MAG: ABC transporter permease [Methanomassiliicoccaceae archaeon]|nr:ABC transporter permease [Methanomassiliicoccaceae archaeon]